LPDMYVAERSLEDMRRREEAVRQQHAASINAKRRTDTAKTVALIALAAGCAWTVFNNGLLAAKVAGREVVYSVLQPNGAFVSSIHYTEVVPPVVQDQQIQNALWTYIQARDCFGSSSLIRQYYIAQSMSDDRVGRQIHDQFDLTNPQAPQHVYGDHNITVQCELVDPPALIGDRANNQYLFRFRRVEETPRTTPADRAAAPFYTATVRFRTGVYPEDPGRAWLDRAEFNAPGVQVIDYPGAKPENAKPVKPRTN
jgi:hypothetical protein